jgi:hypothetical protein
MEITRIDTTHTIKKVVPKELVPTTHVEDSISISTDAKKHAEWVEMVRDMPNIRPEKIAAALLRLPISAAELARHMLQSDI